MSHHRLLLMLSLSCGSWLVIYPIESQAASLGLGACFGFLLSTDVSTGLGRIIDCISITSKKQVLGNRSRPNTTASYSCSKIFYFMVVIIGTASISTLTSIFVIDKNKESLLDLIGYSTISSLVVERISGNCLTNYLIFGLIKNPFCMMLRRGKGKKIVMLIRKIFANCSKLLCLPFVFYTLYDAVASKSN